MNLKLKVETSWDERKAPDALVRTGGKEHISL